MRDFTPDTQKLTHCKTSISGSNQTNHQQRNCGNEFKRLPLRNPFFFWYQVQDFRIKFLVKKKKKVTQVRFMG